MNIMKTPLILVLFAFVVRPISLDAYIIRAEKAQDEQRPKK
jgi:hypothetical protein